MCSLIDIETAVMPTHHVFDDPFRQAVGLEQLEHLLPEQGLQVGRAGLVGLLEPAFSVEAAVRGADRDHPRPVPALPSVRIRSGNNGWLPDFSAYIPRRPLGGPG